VPHRVSDKIRDFRNVEIQDAAFLHEASIPTLFAFRAKRDAGEITSSSEHPYVLSRQPVIERFSRESDKE